MGLIIHMSLIWARRNRYRRFFSRCTVPCERAPNCHLDVSRTTHKGRRGGPAKPLQGRSMALLPPMYTTNATRPRTQAAKPQVKLQSKPKSKSLLKGGGLHARFLKRLGVGDLQRKITVPAPEPAYARPSPDIPSMNSLSGTTAAARTEGVQGQASTVGVATMHKSKLVAVFCRQPERRSKSPG